MTGIPIVDKIFAAIQLLIVAATVAVFIYTEQIYQRPLPEDSKEFVKFVSTKGEEFSGKAYKLDKVTLNLFSRKNRLRFLDVQIHLMPFKPKGLKVMEDNKELIYDSIVDVVGQMKAQEVNSIAGKILLENRIKNKINTRLRRPVVKKLFFTTFVVQ